MRKVAPSIKKNAYNPLKSNVGKAKKKLKNVDSLWVSYLIFAAD